MAFSQQAEWTVKITGLSPSISAEQLADALSIEEDRVAIPRNQHATKNNYAWINGFQNEEEANHHATLWDGRTIENIKIRSNATKSNRIFVPDKIDRNGKRNPSLSMDRINSSTSTGRSIHPQTPGANDARSSGIQLGTKKCSSGMNCIREDCHFGHPEGWRVCSEKSACEDVDCTASHPKDRPRSCPLRDRCRRLECLFFHSKNRLPYCEKANTCCNYDCSLLHTVYRLGPCDKRGDCKYWDCPFLHPESWNPDIHDEIRGKNSNNSSSRNTLKDFKTRVLERKQAGLPILESRDVFLNRLVREKVLVVVAETGSGKSTQLPQYCAEYFTDGLIVCTQTRVIAAVSLARRVAEEFDGAIEGNSVGFQVGGGSGRAAVVKGSKIMYMTDAALIQKAQNDPNLSDVRVLVIDEAHERSLNTDLVVGIAKLLRDRRPNDFHVVVASATINPDEFLKFFKISSTNLLNVPGRIFPVTEEYIPPPDDCNERNLIEKHVVPTLVDMFPRHNGNTLVFLHGQREIERAIDLFNAQIPERCVAYPLYGSLSPEEQDRVLKFDNSSGERMVVFCTNIAETSLTINNTCLVIDTGLTKETRFDVHRHLTVIETVKISKASAKQRKGRAGRTASGHCIRLYKPDDLTRDSIQPEILRSSLDLVTLQLIGLGLNPKSFPFLNPPAEEHIIDSLKLLTKLSCITNEVTITDLGRLYALLALDPRFSDLLKNLYTQVGGESLLRIGAVIVGILSAPGSIFYMGGGDKDAKAEARRRVAKKAAEYNSDLFYFYHTFQQWQKVGIPAESDKECQTCGATISKYIRVCRRCRASFALENLFNNKILHIVENSVDFYTKTVMNPRWKLSGSTKTLSDNVVFEVMGEELHRLFPEQLGHFLVKHLPIQGIRLVQNEIRAKLSDTCVFAQRIPDNQDQFFITMSVIQLSNGEYIADRLHPVPLRCVPKTPMKLIIEYRNIGSFLVKEIRKEIQQITSESWTKWIVFEHDQSQCLLKVWNMSSEENQTKVNLKQIFDNVQSRSNERDKELSHGSLKATFSQGFICKSFDSINQNLRLDLHNIPCRTKKDLNAWFRSNVGITLEDVGEHSFTEVSELDNEDDVDNEELCADPFFIVMKTRDSYEKMQNKLSEEYKLPLGSIQGTAGLKIQNNERSRWGKQLLLTISMEEPIYNVQDVRKLFGPNIIDCRTHGTHASIGLWLKNLSLDIEESDIKAILRSINVSNIRPTNPARAGIGSRAFSIFFHNENDKNIAKSILEKNICNRPTTIMIETKTGAKRRINTIPVVTDFISKNRSPQMFILTMENRASTSKLYDDWAKSSKISGSLDSRSVVTVRQFAAYTDLAKLVEDIAKKFYVGYEQDDSFKPKNPNQPITDKRWIFKAGSPSNTGAAAAMLARLTTPIIIKMKNVRQEYLFRELFDRNLIQDWAEEHQLVISRRPDRPSNDIEICGDQTRQGAFMRQIADYSDGFDQRFRIYHVNTSISSLLSRQTTAAGKLEEINAKWAKENFSVKYESYRSCIVIHGHPECETTKIEQCESELELSLNSLVSSESVNKKPICVFCGNESKTARTLRLCGHSYCDCASEKLLQDFPVRCGEGSCRKYLDIQDCLDILTDAEDRHSIMKKSVENDIKTNPRLQNLAFCPNPECNSLLERSAHYQQCLSCERSVCPICRVIDEDSHEGITCQALQALDAMHDFISELFDSAETFAKNNWPPNLPPIRHIERNKEILKQCLSYKLFRAAVPKVVANCQEPSLSLGFFAFHGTSPDALKPICINGFDPKRRSGQVYGVGEYFGVTANISDGYTRVRDGFQMKRMLIAFLLNSHQIKIVRGFCYVVNNPVDCSYAYNLPVLIISYGTGSLPKPIFDKGSDFNDEDNNDHWTSPFRWYWKNDNQQFQLYTENVSHLLEKYYDQSKCHRGPRLVTTPPIIRFVDDRPQSYNIDFEQNTQTNPTTNYQRLITRKSVPIPNAQNWWFLDENNQWKKYDSFIQDEIERLFQNYLKGPGSAFVNINVPGRPEIYEINFQTGIQKNLQTSTSKKIKRE